METNEKDGPLQAIVGEAVGWLRPDPVGAYVVDYEGQHSFATFTIQQVY